MSKVKEELTGEYMMALAVAWRNQNERAWDLMVEKGESYVEQRRRFSMEKLLQYARYDMETNGHSQGFKVNNNTRAGLARMMRDEHPEFKDYMEIRKSKVDWK